MERCLPVNNGEKQRRKVTSDRRRPSCRGLGGDNCLVLSENTSVQLFRYGELLEAHLLSGTMSWYLPTPEAMPFALLYCNEALTAELNSLCGYMQYESPDWGIFVRTASRRPGYAGQPE
jgi:hypothetical protein